VMWKVSSAISMAKSEQRPEQDRRSPLVMVTSACVGTPVSMKLCVEAESSRARSVAPPVGDEQLHGGGRSRLDASQGMDGNGGITLLFVVADHLNGEEPLAHVTVAGDVLLVALEAKALDAAVDDLYGR
jgi:hypothetical protein